MQNSGSLRGGKVPPLILYIITDYHVCFKYFFSEFQIPRAENRGDLPAALCAYYDEDQRAPGVTAKVTPGALNPFRS